VKIKLTDVIFTKRFLQSNTKSNELKIFKNQLSKLIYIPRNKILMGKEKIKKYLTPTRSKQ